MKAMVNYDSSAKYVGQIVNGKRHGRGVLMYANGNRYEGNFAYGEFCHRGVFFYANGDRYEGDFAYNKHHGRGVLTFANGDKYEGDFAYGKIHGVGTFSYINGDVYEGEFLQGKYHGMGTYTYANGNKYEGSFEFGQYHGRGTCHFVAVSKYQGEFVEGKFHGRGLWVHPDGTEEAREYRHDEWINQPEQLHYVQPSLAMGERRGAAVSLRTLHENDYAQNIVRKAPTYAECTQSNAVRTANAPTAHMFKHGHGKSCLDRAREQGQSQFLQATPVATESYYATAPQVSSNVADSGKGVYYFANGDRFESGGEDGKGTYFYANGDRFESK